MPRRILAIAIAIVLATMGTIGGVFLVLSAESRAQNQISNPVMVAVATVPIPIGTTGAEIREGGMVRLVKMPKDSVPDDTMSEISVELDSLAVSSTLAVGQLLLRAHFGSRSAVTSGLPLPEGKMAVTVETGAPEQVAGYVQAGSQVAIFLTYDVVDSNGNATGIERTRVLIPRVEVLAIGTNQRARTSTGGGGSGSLLLTLAVDQTQAERLIEGLSHGTLYLALLTDSVVVTPGAGVDNTDDSDGNDLF
jgi:pilus assembly protein CpaB